MTERMVDSGTSGERGGHDSGRRDGEQQRTTPPAPARAPRPEAQPAPVTDVPFEV